MALTKVRGAGIDADGQEIILDADQDTTVSVDTDDQVDIKVGGQNIVHVKSNALGVGTSSPDFPLDIEGSVADDAVTTVVRISADDPAASGDHAELQIKLGNGASSTTTRRVELHAFSNNGSDNRNISLNPSGGFVLFGCTSLPDTTVGGAGFEEAGDDRMILNLSTTTTSSRNQVVFRNPNGAVGTINTSGSTTGFNTSSDYRLKENVVTDWDATTRFKQLKPSRFNWKADKSTTVDGFLAHEVSSVVPQAVYGEKDAVDADGNPEYQGIDQSKLVPLLTKSLQEALARIETLEAKVTALESK